VTRSITYHIHVRVPATTANLGCGFDVLGLALQLYNTFTFAVTEKPGWRVSVPPGLHVPSNDQNLAYRAARRLFERVGSMPPGLHLSLAINIPLARGLGSSSSAIVGGLMAANYLAGNPLDRQALLAMAIDIEGHPDNVTPALMGGLTLSYTTRAQHRYVSLPFPQDLAVIVAIPDFELSTAYARSVLPTQVPRADAVFNCGRTALLVYALQNQRYDLLATAMEDRLHQPYRAALIPGMTEAIAAASAAGALGVALSGAGPTLLALARERPDAIAAAFHHAFLQHGIACQTRQLQADTTGAVVQEATTEYTEAQLLR
jgi:homoserine kinase